MTNDEERRAIVTQYAAELRSGVDLTWQRLYALSDKILEAFGLHRRVGLRVSIQLTRQASSHNLRLFTARALDRLAAEQPTRTGIRTAERRLLATGLSIQWEETASECRKSHHGSR